MALLFMDSFDHYSTADVAEKWTARTAGGSGDNSALAAVGRRGSNGWRMTPTGASASNNTHALSVTLAPTSNTVIVGFALNPVTAHSQLDAGTDPQGTGTSGTACLLLVRNSGTDQCWIRLNQDGTVSAYRGSTLLGSSTTTLTVGTFTYVETLVTVHNTTGAVTVRFNGTSVLSLSNQNTRGGTGDAWNEVRLGWFSPSGAYNPEWDFDDIYILDGAGSGPWNTFLGDCRVDPSYPDAAGATSGWTASTGANYTTVDETTPNDDTDYVSTSTVNAVDTYAFQAAPVAGATIFGIQHCLSMKKADAGLCVVAPIVRHSGTDYVGSGLSPSTSYGYGLQIAQTNPGTSAQWTETDFNSAEFGFKRTS